MPPPPPPNGHRCCPTSPAMSTTWYSLPLLCETVCPNLDVTRRYGLSLVFPSCCVKPCAQTLTYYSQSDLNLITSVYACIIPTNLDDFAKIIGCRCGENILCNHLSWCKHAIKRSGASDLDLTVTVILYLTPST
jgi:hypothetical protein